MRLLDVAMGMGTAFIVFYVVPMGVAKRIEELCPNGACECCAPVSFPWHMIIVLGLILAVTTALYAFIPSPTTIDKPGRDS